MDCKLFASLAEEEVRDIIKCSKSKEKKYESGEYIFRQGDVPQNIFIVVSGTVNISKEFASGKRTLLFSAGKGDIFGEMYLFSKEKKYWYDAYAGDKTKLIVMPWKFIYSFCDNTCNSHRLLVKNMLEIQAEKNFMMTRKLYLLSGTTLREKISMWILDNEKDGYFLTDLSREELADYLGTTRPSLSRELMNMKNDGIIDIDKNSFKVIDRETLEEYAVD